MLHGCREVPQILNSGRYDCHADDDVTSSFILTIFLLIDTFISRPENDWHMRVLCKAAGDYNVARIADHVFLAHDVKECNGLQQLSCTVLVFNDAFIRVRK